MKKLLPLLFLILFCKSKEEEGKTGALITQDTLKRIEKKSVKIKDPGEDRLEAPEFSLPDLEGNMHSLKEFRGKVMILDFWATWCMPCRVEIPRLIDIYARYRRKGVEIIGVGIDKKEAILALKNEMGINYKILVDEKGDVARRYGVRGIPATYILDKKGRITEKHVGFRPGMEKRFEMTVKKLLKENY